jgi:hypothetical protein
LRSSARTGRRRRIAAKNVDENGWGPSTRFLDRCVPDRTVITGGQLGGAGAAGDSSEDVADLRAPGEWVQVGGGSSVTSGSGGQLRGFTGRSLCCTVGLQRCSPLEVRPRGPFRESPGCADGGAGSCVPRVSLLEELQDFLSTLDGVPGDYPQLIHGQVEITGYHEHDARWLCLQPCQKPTSYAVASRGKAHRDPRRADISVRRGAGH